jgi:hypothetical protein
MRIFEKGLGVPIRTNSEWVFLKTDPETIRYYCQALKNRGFNLKPTGLPHITVVASKYESYLGPLPQIEVEFKMGDLLTEDGYFWIDIECEWIHSFRESVGLKRDLKFNPHLTIGRLNPEWGKQTVKRVIR